MLKYLCRMYILTVFMISCQLLVVRIWKTMNREHFKFSNPRPHPYCKWLASGVSLVMVNE